MRLNEILIILKLTTYKCYIFFFTKAYYKVYVYIYAYTHININDAYKCET
jgi:hypothetical protein